MKSFNFQNSKEIVINSSTIDNLDNETENQSNKNDNNNILFATQIYCLKKDNTDKKVDELISDLEKYKKEVQEYIKYRKNIPHYKFRKTILKQIELNLIQIGEMKNKEKRDESINKLYKWYKNKLNFYYTLCRMNKRSYLKDDENFDMTKYNLAKKKEKENADGDNEMKHRTVITYKKIHYYIEEFRKHQLKDKKGRNNGNKSVEMRPMYKRMKNIFSKTNDLSKYYTKIIDIKKADVGNFDKNIPKYEIKGPYSIERPKYNIVSLQVEKKINALKNKYLAEKRSQDEINKKVDNFGKNRAIYKSNINKNLEIKKVIKEFKSFQNFESLTNTKNNSTIEIKNNNNFGKDINNKNNEQKKNMRRINKINLNNIKNMNNNNLLITSLPNNNNKTNDDSRNIKTIRNKFLINKQSEDYSVNSKEEENINKEKIININCEFPKLESNSTLLLTKKEQNDTTMKNIAIDPVFRTKRITSKLCSLKNKSNSDIINRESKYFLSNTKYMSAANIYDMVIEPYVGAKNIHNYTKQNFSVRNNNFLKIKKNFGSFKKEEFLKLKTFINEKEHNDTLNKTALYTAFIDPKINVIYPNFYLPRNNGYNLLLSKQK